MERIWSHPYVVAICIAIALLLIGSLIVSSRSAVQPRHGGTLQVWGGISATLQDPTASGPAIAEAEASLYTDVRQGAPFSWTPVQMSGAEEASEPGFDLDTFLQELSETGRAEEGSEDGTSLADAYSFIPQGLISTNVQQKNMTAAQNALHMYGNDAGGAIQSFESIYRDSPQILKDQFEDPEDSVKRARLLELAQGLVGVGDALLSIEDVPSSARSANKALAESYRAMGDALARIPDFTAEKELLEAMLAYNASVEAFVKNYVAIATLFSISGVSFKPDEAGSVFMFTSGSAF